MVWEYLAMRWAGEGSELWRVRVDLFAEDEERSRIASDALRGLLSSDDEEDRAGGGVGSDHGTGIAGRSVVGLLFWVQPTTLG